MAKSDWSAGSGDLFPQRETYRVAFSIAMIAALVLSCLGVTVGLHPVPAAAQTAAARAAPPPLSITILVSSRRDQCYESGIVPAIEQVAMAEQNRINASGGILGRPLRLRFLDDARQPEQTTANLKLALADPYSIAIIGLSSTARAKVAFDALAADISANNIPFLSDISVNSIFEKQPNVFTMRPSQDDERVPLLTAFIKERDVQRPAFIGLRDVLFSSSLGDGLKNAGEGSAALIADHRFVLQNGKLEPAALAAAVADLKEKNPDLVFLAIGASRSRQLLAAMIEAGVTPPLFVTGRIESILSEDMPEYPGDIFQLAWDDLPDVFSDRLRQRIVRNGLKRWIFEGSRVPEAPGWASGECRLRTDTPGVFDAGNMRAIGRGTQYADMVALIAEALKSADPKADVAALRAHLLTRIKTAYAAGRGAFRGSFENWSFRSGSRAADRTPFIVMRPNGLGATQLAPLQFVRLRTDKLRRMDTLYLDIDLIRTFRVDDNDKSFFAEFYLSMRGNNASINQIEFANGFLDPNTNDRQITIRKLHDGSPSEIYPQDMMIFMVSGKFTFEPRLATYPFDTQRFSIDIRPKSADAPFIIQPPPRSLRDGAVITDGWIPREQYVGFDEDFVPTIDAWTFRQSIVPFYKASFVWLMKRQAVDYYLRVVVPLAFILAVAYLSIFIPPSHFEAIVTIQVTALLSAVALYLALPKLDADDGTTLSDRIFLFIYMAVSLMILLSILRVSRPIVNLPRLRKTIGFLHVVLIPAMVAGMALYVYNASLGEGSGSIWTLPAGVSLPFSLG